MLTGYWNLQDSVRNRLILLTFIATIALGVRGYRMGSGVLSVDESFSWRLTQYTAVDLTHHTARDVHPPLYYLALKAWGSIWGDSVQAMCGFSMLCGVLSILMLYVLCLEAAKGKKSSFLPPGNMTHCGALFSASIMAIHLSQITPSRTARMYSLGVLLASLTSWLLLRALRATKNQELWWSAYGLAVTAFCYTHYYAFFTVCAQGVFVLGDVLIRASRASFRDTLPSIFGFVLAGTLVLLLYSPWLPVLSQQIQEVRRTYWIPAVTPRGTERVFFTWLTGTENWNRSEVYLWYLWLAPVVGVILWRIIRSDRAAYFFLVQAAVPWLLSLGISIWIGRSIFVPRYLAFAHLSLLGLWGVLWYRLSEMVSRVLLACWIVLPCLYGLSPTLSRVPKGLPAIAKAAAVLKQHYQPGEVVFVASPPEVNLLRYYAKQAGLETLSVRCSVTPFLNNGHIIHAASLQAEEFAWPDEQADMPSTQRMWHGSSGNGAGRSPPEGMQTILEETFHGTGGTHYTLVLYERTESVRAANKMRREIP